MLNNLTDKQSFSDKEFQLTENLFGCLHPSIIFNKYTNAYESVPCKKCEYCMNVSASAQSQRVRKEIEQHIYSVFFTLTYSNEFIPRMEMFKDKYGKTQFKHIGRTASMHDSTPYNSKGLDHKYRYNDDTTIPEIEKNEQKNKKDVQFAVVCKKDIQNFLKRLRKKIDKLNLSDNDKKIRYYISSEYGPVTKRPHYHGIIFFDSAELGSQIKDLIVESWGLFEKEPGTFNEYTFTPFADTWRTKKHIKYCNPNTAKYVAEYISGNMGLPKMLQERCSKPFHLQSKNPVIGEFKASREETFTLIDQGIIRQNRTIFTKNGVETKANLRISKDSLYSVFRKCYRFGELSNDTKYNTYNFYTKHIREWKEYINVKLINYAIKNRISFDRVNLSRYLRKNRADYFRNWCATYKSEEYNRLEMDKDQNWYSSKNVYKLSQELNPIRYSYLGGFTRAYLIVFDRYLYLYEQDRLREFYNKFNNLIDEVGYYPAELEVFPVLKHAIPKVKKYTPHGVNLSFDTENAKEERLRPYINYIFNTSFQYWVTPYNEFGSFDHKKYGEEYSARNTKVFEQYVEEQKNRLDRRNKSKKLNNTTINNERVMD